MNSKWKAIAREAALAAEHLGAGATILGKANYAHHAHYGQAFFSLSAGFERAAKLAIVVDHALANHGRFPPSNVLRGYGHDLERLLCRVDAISTCLNLGDAARLPQSAIHKGIISVLSDFANNVTRYYNIDLLAGDSRAAGKEDPVAAWFRAVVKPILEVHYSAERQERDRCEAATVEHLIGAIAMVRHTAETGEDLSTVFEASLQTARSEFAKPYARMYVLQIVRFVARVLSELSGSAWRRGSCDIPYLADYFAIFNNDDKYFFKRRTWSIYRP
jgi:hypothetical protein